MTAAKSEPKDFRKLLGAVSRQCDFHQTFVSFVRLAACALAAQTREAEYLEEAKRWEKPDLELISKALGALIVEMESKPFEDILGCYYMEFAISSKSQQWTGEFHTAKPVADLMAKIMVGELAALPAEGPITVCEPACGAGAMILSLAEACPPQIRRRLRVTAVDINRTACDMTFINTTLWGVPTRIIHGNSISLECWAAWSNIHYIAPWLPYALRPQAPEAQEQGQPPNTAEVERIKATLVQQELGFG